MVAYSAGTWRRLKIAAELRVGHGIPKVLPRDDLLRILGLLVGIEDGRADELLRDDDLQLREGRRAWPRDDADPDSLRSRIHEAAAKTDVRRFL